MVAGPARGAILGACFRPWCDKRRPRSRSRLFLGRPVRHPGTSAVGARAATRHPGNKRQVLLLACLRACPRGGTHGVASGLRGHQALPCLRRYAAAPSRVHPLLSYRYSLPPHRFSADAVRSLTCTLCCFCIISCKCCTYIAVHTCTYPMDGARECSFAGSRAHLAAGRPPFAHARGLPARSPAGRRATHTSPRAHPCTILRALHCAPCTIPVPWRG